jgi:predicted Zn-dependent protease
MINKNEAKKICQKALSYVEEGQAEVMLNQTVRPLTRIANNSIHQNVEVADASLSLRLDIGDRSGRANTNQFDERSLAKLAKQAAEAARAIGVDQGLPPMARPQRYRAIKGYSEATAMVEPAKRAAMVKKAVDLAKKSRVELAGLVSNTGYVHAMANTKGLFAYHRQSAATMEITARQGLAAGRAEQTAKSIGRIDPAKVASRAIAKCLGTVNARALEPGAYTVILEPEAAATPLQFMAWLAFGAQSVQEGTSCLSGNIGKKLFGSNITIVDDAFHPLMNWAEPFDYEGIPKRRVVIVDKGVAKTPVYDQKTAAKEKKKTTGHGLPQPNTFGPFPQNLVLKGGMTTLEQMIKSTERGILVTRFWYNRVVDRKVPVITGMTRDGTFLIENGKIVCGVKNMRFNQNLTEFFNNVEALGPAETKEGMVVPPMKVRDFHFTGRTE